MCVEVESLLRYVVNGKSREQITFVQKKKKKCVQFYLWKYVQEAADNT